MNDTVMILGLEWYCWPIFLFAIFCVVVIEAKGEKRRKIRRKFYRQRRQEYDEALPDKYPYIAGWSGVDSGDMAIVRTGPVSHSVMPMSVAKERGYPIHPASGLHPNVDATPYVGDGYRSVKQMKGDFKK